MTINFIAPSNKASWPILWHKCFKSWQKYYSNIILWNDNEIDYLLKNYDYEFYKLLNSVDKIFKLDYVRALILYKYGGMYSDMDVELKSPFLHQLKKNETYIIGASCDDEYVQNSLMIGSDKNLWEQFLKFSKELVKKHIEDIKKFPNTPNEKIPGTIVRKTVGPIALSQFVLKNPVVVNVLPGHLFNNSSEISFTKHHQTSTWGLKN
jgi:mannosyltransferase OCH1-like enzyme